VSLPERTRVRIQIIEEAGAQDDLQQAEAVLVASGLVKPLDTPPNLPTVSKERRAELAHLYAAGGPLSEVVITDNPNSHL